MPKPKGKSAATRTSRAETYVHPKAEVLLRPDVGTQAQFKKSKPPKKYRYDSSLSPVLEWDGQNAAREQGEAAIREMQEAAAALDKSLDGLKAVKSLPAE